MKPLATLGDAIADKGGNWRADLRANDIQRRGRPDRGYVDTSPPPSEPKKVVIPLSELTLAQSLKDEEKQPRRRIETPTLTAPVALIRPQLFDQTVPPPPDLETRQLPPLPSELPPSMAAALSMLSTNEIIEPRVSQEPEQAPPEPAPEARPEVPAKARAARRTFPAEFREKCAIEALTMGLRGESTPQIKLCRKYDVNQAVMSQWVTAYKATHPKWQTELDPNAPKKAEPPSVMPQSFVREQTMLSAPMSAPVSNGAPPPPLPQLRVSIDGLEQYIEELVNAKVDARVQKAMASAMQRMFMGMGNGS